MLLVCVLLMFFYLYLLKCVETIINGALIKEEFLSPFWTDNKVLFYFIHSSSFKNNTNILGPF